MATTVIRKVSAKKAITSVVPAAKKKPVTSKLAPPVLAKAPKKSVLKKPAVTLKKPAAINSKVKPVAELKEKPKKAKLVRDSFTMPEMEYVALSNVKKACLQAGFEVKKSELLRIGVALISKLPLPALRSAVAELAPLKPGRPRKEK